MTGANYVDVLRNEEVLRRKGEKSGVRNSLKKKGELTWSLQVKRLSDTKCNGGIDR